MSIQIPSQNRVPIAERIHQGTMIWDGAMGTGIQQKNPPADAWGDFPGCQEFLVISQPGIITRIHQEFLEAGADVIETDTFGGNALTLESHGLGNRTRELNHKAAELARLTVDAFPDHGRPRYVAGSMGPGSRLPSIGDVDFDTLRDAFLAQAEGLITGGVDLIQIETCQDLLQVKAAVSAVRRAYTTCGRSVPFIVQVTLEKDHMLLGSDILTALHAVLPLNPLAFGVNCGTGPEGMEDSIDRLSRHCPIPIIIMPNAGMPRMEDGIPLFDLSPEDFSRHMRHYADQYGVSLLGGCCGTTAAHIQALATVMGAARPSRSIPDPAPAFTSMFQIQATRVKPPPMIIGERANANGSRAFRRSLLADDWDAMAEIAREQELEGAHMLDLSVAYAGRNEVTDLAEITSRLNRELHIPLVFDSTNPEALEAGLKRYGGHSLINSINLEDGGIRAEKIIHLAREYGAGLICLAIDETGMARDHEHKLAVCERLYRMCTRAGIAPQALYFDPLTFTLASGDPGLFNAGVETLNALPGIREKWPLANTILGVSNISYGLKPAARRIINSVFLYQAVQHGLDAAIFHAGKVIPLHRIDREARQLAEDLIFNRRQEGNDPLEAILEWYSQRGDSRESTKDRSVDPVFDRLESAVLDGRKAGLEATLNAALQSIPALDIINHHLLPTMQKVGDLFSTGRMQLPFVLKAAEVMKSAVDLLSPHLDPGSLESKGSMVLATVRGDVHDIGKNLVDIILTNNGYRIFNCGINQSSSEIISSLRRHQPDALGVSGLLVQSTLEMKELLLHMNREKLELPVICGGAALTRDYVNSELVPAFNGPVHYAADAFDALRILQGKGHREAKTSQSAPLPPKSRAYRPESSLTAPFHGRRHIRLSLDDIEKSLDRATLFRTRWKMTPDQGAEQSLKEIIQALSDAGVTEFGATYGYFACIPDPGNNCILLPEAGEKLHFAAAPHPPSACFAINGDTLPVLAVTCGAEIASLVQLRFRREEYSDYLLWYGFSAQLAETMAAEIHRKIADEMGVDFKQSRRFSPGYPSWPDLSQQKILDRLLGFSDLGITMTESHQLVPEASVSAAVVPRYRVVRI